ncbi:zinc finger MYM-type protein 1-like [Rhopalosiphum padi]|uniref:zinc finger MYM-type protein 1-like n=1 Tax=Rhopalosiphum padi TaxID=40932 RepID=UPI00298EB0DC|nr:zinc finger MYM-type protein 1-like [Rhopalosiphum padi]
MTANLRWSAYKNSVKNGDVIAKMSTALQKEIQTNRMYIKCLIDIVLYLGRQGIAFRGHHEDETSVNKGNFKEMCEFLLKHYPDFCNVYKNTLLNHTSWSIQNELIETCAANVKSTIIQKIIDCGMFSISCDEARSHKQEQLSICVRYPHGMDIYERFLGFVDVSEKQTADALVLKLVEFLNASKLDKIPIIGQAYDGANVMSGHIGGVQAKLKIVHPPAKCAVYVHCMAHKINLVVIDMCKHLKDARNLFNALEALYVHFSHPTRNGKLTDLQFKLNMKKTTLSQLSDTRWICRFKSCDAVIKNFNAIAKVLNDEIDDQQSKCVAQAIGIVSTISNFKFVAYLFILHDILKVVNILSIQLQSKSATLGNSANLIKGVIDTLKSYRSSIHYSELWEKMVVFSKENGIEINVPFQDGSKRQRRESTNLKNYVVMSSTSAENNHQSDNTSTTTLEPKEYWKIHAFYPVIDTIICQMKERFSEESIQIATCVDNLLKLDFEGSSLLINHYKNLFEVIPHDLKCEMTVLKNMIKGVPSYLTIKEKISKDTFPNLFKMIQLAITLPVSSATCERSFSAMRRINNYLRFTMSQERFSKLAILNIERDIIVDTEIILNTFANKNRKIRI